MRQAVGSDAVVLHETGFLSAGGPRGRFDLLLDDDGLSWLLLAPPASPGAAQAIASRHGALDAALGALAAACGRPGPFRVRLPCGNEFARPGRVPADEVLAAFGYAPVGTLTAYARLAMPPGSREPEVVDHLARRVTGKPARPAEVEPMDDDGSWCCALTLLHPGIFRHGGVDDVASDLLDGTGLDLIGRVELDPGPRRPAPNAAKVIRLVPLVVAA